MIKKFSKKIVFILVLIILALPFFVFADTQGQIKDFFIDSSYDSQNREQVSAFLKKISQNGYFYLESNWYENLTEGEKERVNQSLEILAQEFDQTIYPKLTSIYGQEWKPGIDNDERITILFHQMKTEVAGYFNVGDEYEKIQNPRSNEREMIYLNSDNIFYELINSYLAHEFVHLITFNQKDRLRGISEEIWLNEARADYGITLLGYDAEYQGSNLQQRVRVFMENPSDSLTEWQNQKKDYGVTNIFIQYLVDHYGQNLLVESLHSNKVGIPSLDYGLEKNKVEREFWQIFTDWTIAIFVNNCNFGEKFCYKNKNLQNLKVTPSLIFLPSIQRTNVSLNYSIKQWSGNWYRIIGGEGELKLEFKGDRNVEFKMPYVLCKSSIDCQVEFLELDKEQKGEVSFENFGNDWTSLTLIPSVQSKTLGFDGREPSFKFSLSVSIESKTEEKLIAELQAKIVELKAQIVELQAKIAAILEKRETCGKFSQNLYLGMKNDYVRCLQEFLMAQGKEIYPQGLITGFFGSLTEAAVIRFQEKYREEILLPLGLKNGTGFVGPSTRSKINQLLSF